MSTPIINPPQSGILGMHAIKKRPVVVDDQVVIRPMMYLALSYDHRLIDGREAVSFLVRVKDLIESPGAACCLNIWRCSKCSVFGVECAVLDGSQSERLIGLEFIMLP